MCDHTVFIFISILFTLAHFYESIKRIALFVLVKEVSKVHAETEEILTRRIVEHEKLILNLLEYNLRKES